MYFQLNIQITLDDVRLNVHRVDGRVNVELETSSLGSTAECEVLTEHFIGDHLMLEPAERRLAWDGLEDITVDK